MAAPYLVSHEMIQKEIFQINKKINSSQNGSDLGQCRFSLQVIKFNLSNMCLLLVCAIIVELK